MSESILFDPNSTRADRYRELLPQIEALVGTETDVIANLANIAAVLREAFGFFWIGFYLVKEGELVLGPFQGPIACTRIPFGKGVCGHAWAEAKSVVVPDVDKFPGHIACSSASRSEIVVPLFDRERNVIGVLDVDSDKLADLDETDAAGLETIARVAESCIADS